MRGPGRVWRCGAGCRRSPPDRHAVGSGRGRDSEFCAQAAHGLHPAEDLFDPLAYPLTHRVAGMPRGAAVERGTPGATLIARDGRGDLERAAGRDELSSVVALVGTECYPPGCPATQSPASRVRCCARRSRRPVRPRTRAGDRCGSPSARWPSNTTSLPCPRPSSPASLRGRWSIDGSRCGGARRGS